MNVPARYGLPAPDREKLGRSVRRKGGDPANLEALSTRGEETARAF